jgi:large subunit ribosomal protein L21e
MPHAYGYRSRTRDLFSRAFRRHGAPHLSTFLVNYKIGDYVDIKGDGSAHKGMPYKFYHGRTGIVFNVNPNSIGVIVNKQIRNRIIHKRIHVRLEHLKKSTCLQDLKARVKRNETLRKANKENKNAAVLKRQPVGPKGEFFVDSKATTVLFQNPEFHKEIF